MESLLAGVLLIFSTIWLIGGLGGNALTEPGRQLADVMAPVLNAVEPFLPLLQS